MRHDRLDLPTGQRVTAQQVLIGVALLELGASNDSEVAHRILKYPRAYKEYGVIRKAPSGALFESIRPLVTQAK